MLGARMRGGLCHIFLEDVEDAVHRVAISSSWWANGVALVDCQTRENSELLRQLVIK